METPAPDPIRGLAADQEVPGQARDGKASRCEAETV